MNHSCRLSNVTKDYLTQFDCILGEMIMEMTHVQLSDSISYNFIVQMIPHHRAAIEMSRNLLQYTTFIPLQDIAMQIISEQTKSIQNMEEVLKRCSCITNPDCELDHYQYHVDQIMEVMFSGMENACSTNQINANFMREMIPHHQGAVEMSKNALCHDICPELEPILSAIITSQEAGIKKMQRLLRCM